MFDAQNEAQGEHGPGYIAGDHDTFAVETIEQHAGDGSGGQHGNGAGEEDPGDDDAGVHAFHREAHDRDVVEVIADFADDLAGPGIPVVPVGPKESGECAQSDVGRTPSSARVRPRTGAECAQHGQNLIG
jgi:hypothetical protein